MKKTLWAWFLRTYQWLSLLVTLVERVYNKMMKGITLLSK